MDLALRAYLDAAAAARAAEGKEAARKAYKEAFVSAWKAFKERIARVWKALKEGIARVWKAYVEAAAKTGGGFEVHLAKGARLPSYPQVPPEEPPEGGEPRMP
jgi:cation transport regulator ChaB